MYSSSYNTLRLWQPQISAILDEFSALPNDPSREDFTFCEILDFSTASKANETAARSLAEDVVCVAVSFYVQYIGIINILSILYNKS